LNLVQNALIVSQKIISCVLRLNEKFGGDYTAMVLIGSKEQRITDNGHDALSTWGILSEFNKRIVRDWVEQLAAQGYMEKVGEYNVLNVTEKGWGVLKGKETPRLLQPPPKREKNTKLSKVTVKSWGGVDRGLFEELRILRRQIAEQRSVPAFIIFGDTSLRDMARLKPKTLDDFLEVNGVGEKKCKDFGQAFTRVIKEYCQQNHR